VQNLKPDAASRKNDSFAKFSIVDGVALRRLTTMENPFLKRAVFLPCAFALAYILMRLGLPQGNSSFGQTFPIQKIANKQILPITFKEASKEYGENRRSMIFRSSRIEISRPLKWSADTPSIQQVSAQRLWVAAQAVVDRKD
jgi:hypothetical protein